MMHRVMFAVVVGLIGLDVELSHAAPFDHSVWDVILKQSVKEGRVDYPTIKANHSVTLKNYLDGVAKAKPASMSRDEQLAFYVNAYNALVVQAVIAHWPVKSVMDVKGFFDQKRYVIGEKSMTLNELENNVIRPTFKEPRIHFVLVCAAKSCPPLKNSAFTPSTMQNDLEQLTKRFLQSSNGVAIEGNRVKASQLFNWYDGDFKQAAGSSAKFIARYRPSDSALLARTDLKLDYLDYDWALNQ